MVNITAYILDAIRNRETMKSLPIPSFFDPNKVTQVWRVAYQKRAEEAKQWKEKYQITSSLKDKHKIILLLIDVQNTFCLPDFELFVTGKSGKGAVEDNIRLCEFIYRNLANITSIAATLDTHKAMQIFHPIFWVDEQGNHPQAGMTMISYEAVKQRRLQVNPKIANSLKISLENLENYAL
ncbi:MAG: isochorismatase, partial [Crocosphaera sp.]